ncbi:MAG: hypothetical protein U9N30_01765 [Campylobacterota bacterium]|nr:hypothetical protein [Campylobacterota bacterium]
MKKKIIVNTLLILGTSAFAFSLSDLGDILNGVQKIQNPSAVQQNRIQSSMSKDQQQSANKVLNQFLNILQNNSYYQSSGMVVPLMHRSLLTNNANQLDDDTYRYSFKKAHSNARNYTYPVRITRIQRLKTTGVGYENTYDQGVEYKIWISKNTSQKGAPAPLVVFFKHGAANAQLTYVGSL